MQHDTGSRPDGEAYRSRGARGEPVRFEVRFRWPLIPFRLTGGGGSVQPLVLGGLLSTATTPDCSHSEWAGDPSTSAAKGCDLGSFASRFSFVLRDGDIYEALGWGAPEGGGGQGRAGGAAKVISKVLYYSVFYDTTPISTSPNLI